MKVTRSMLRSWGACYSEKKLCRLMPVRGASLRQIILAEHVPLKDRIWVLSRAVGSARPSPELHAAVLAEVQRRRWKLAPQIRLGLMRYQLEGRVPQCSLVSICYDDPRSCLVQWALAGKMIYVDLLLLARSSKGKAWVVSELDKERRRRLKR